MGFFPTDTRLNLGCSFGRLTTEGRWLLAEVGSGCVQGTRVLEASEACMKTFGLSESASTLGYSPLTVEHQHLIQWMN